MPIVVDKDKMRLSIIEAFQRRAFENPIYEITLRDIATEAGISHASILHYFTNKLEVINEYAKYIMTTCNNKFIEIINQCLEQRNENQTNEDIIIEVSDRIHEYNTETNVNTIFLQIYSMGAFNDEINETLQQYNQLYLETINKFLYTLYGHEMHSHSNILFIIFEGLALSGVNCKLSKKDVKDIYKLIKLD